MHHRIHTLSAKTMRSGKDCTTRVNMFRNAPVFSGIYKHSHFV